VHFQHSGDIWRDFPMLVPGVLYAEGITADAPAGARADRFAAVAKSRLAAVSTEGELPEIQAWRRAFAKMGLKPTQYRCASESLLRRFRKEGNLPRLHPLVDLCNAVSLAFAIPVAVFDVAAVTGPLEVRYAAGDEAYLTFAGDIEHPAAGEVIFADLAGQAHARRWTNRQSGRSAVRDSTAAALIVAEALHDRAPADIPALTAALAAELEAAWSVTPSGAVLTASAPGFTFGVLPEGRDRQAAGRRQQLVFGLLHRPRLAGPAPVPPGRDRAPLVGADRGGGLFEADRAVVQPVRQDDQVGGEPVAAHVRGLEHLSRVPRGERDRERAAEPRAARVALRVPADQEHRLADRRPERNGASGRQPLQVEPGRPSGSAGYLTPSQPGLAPGGPPGEHAVPGPARSRPADQLHPDAQPGGGRDHGPQRLGELGLSRLVRPRPGVLDQQPGPRRLWRRSPGRLRPVVARRTVLTDSGHAGRPPIPGAPRARRLVPSTYARRRGR